MGPVMKSEVEKGKDRIVDLLCIEFYFDNSRLIVTLPPARICIVN